MRQNKNKSLFLFAACSLFALSVRAHQVTVQSSTGGTPTTYEIDDGATLHLIATADAGSHFVQWSDGNTDNPREVVVTGDASYTAVFEADGGGALPEKYTATIYAGDCNPYIGEFNTGSQLSINAVPKEGYKFKRWTDDNTSNPRTLTITSDITLHAEFEPYQGAAALYTVNVQADGCANSVEGRFPAGTELNLIAQPDVAQSGKFEYWEDASTNPVRTENVAGNASYSATFAFPPTTIVVADGESLDICSLGWSAVQKVIVEPGGELTINPTCVHIDSLILMTNGLQSGQIHHGGAGINADHLILEYILNPQGTAASPSLWYAFAVPFEVDLETGISRICDTKTLVSGTDFLVEKYDGSLRASTGKGWAPQLTGSLVPGHFYMLGIDGTCNNWRFEKKAGQPIEGDSHVAMTAYGAGAYDVRDIGWNDLANTRLENVKLTNLNVSGLTYLQIYDNRYNKYVTYPINDVTLSVGQPFVIQTSVDGAFDLVHNTPNTIPALFAKSNIPQRMRFTLTNEQQNVGTDHMYLTLHEEANSGYTIGRDVKRINTNSKTAAQLWCLSAEGTQLTAYGIAEPTNETSIPLGLYVPTNGEYLFEMSAQELDEYNVELLYQGTLLTSFADAQPVTLVLNAGNNNDYSLRIGRKMPSTLDNIQTDNISNTKAIIDGILYIFQGENIYNAQGKKIK